MNVDRGTVPGSIAAAACLGVTAGLGAGGCAVEVRLMASQPPAATKASATHGLNQFNRFNINRVLLDLTIPYRRRKGRLRLGKDFDTGLIGDKSKTRQFGLIE
jgi:hypothetical protein